MLRACQYCGKIHQAGFICKSKPQKRWNGNKDIRQFRNSRQWITKREQIKALDKYLCQACLHNLFGTTKRITTDGLSVHHIIPLLQAWALRLDDNNLITLCSAHHEYAEAGKIKAKELQDITKRRNISPPMRDIEFECVE